MLESISFIRTAVQKTIQIKIIPLVSRLLIIPIAFGYLSFGRYNTVGSAADSDTVQVSLTVEASISLSSPSDLVLQDGAGNIIGYGDTDGDESVTWTVVTNNSAGYTVAWLAEETQGGTSGEMESAANDTIAAYTPAVVNTPETWSVANTDSEWGGRVSSTAECTRDINFGTDSSSETWLNVHHASATQIRNTNAVSGAGGDDVPIFFRAEVGSAKNQPTGEYTVNVTLTATTK